MPVSLLTSARRRFSGAGASVISLLVWVMDSATEACLALFRADGSPSPRGAQKKELSCTNRANLLGGPSVFMGMLTLGEA
jgi:hypothetical protein